MYKAEVEIWSDVSDLVIMRHPDRRYPGLLIQGNDLLGLCNLLADVIANARGTADEATMFGLQFLLDDLRDRMTHYCEIAGDPGKGSQQWRRRR